MQSTTRNKLNLIMAISSLTHEILRTVASTLVCASAVVVLVGSVLNVL
jgi:hypothetical protein